jgi:hypothetical protein
VAVVPCFGNGAGARQLRIGKRRAGGRREEGTCQGRGIRPRRVAKTMAHGRRNNDKDLGMVMRGKNHELCITKGKIGEGATKWIQYLSWYLLWGKFETPCQLLPVDK